MAQVGWSRQLALASALVVLGSFAYWMEYKHKPQEESREEEGKKAISLKDTPVKEVILGDAARRFDVSCADFANGLCKPGDNSKWDLASPVKVKADDANVNALLSSINNLNISDTIDLKDETPDKRAALLKEYGLDPASLAQPATRKLQVTTAKGTQVLYLGLPHPIGESIFALMERVPAGSQPSGKADENKVYLVPNYFKTNFDHDLTYWREKKLFSLSAHEIEAFELDGSKAHVQGARKDGQWSLHAEYKAQLAGRKGKGATAMVGGDELPGDIENIDNLLTAATYLSAKDFVSDRKDDEKSKATLKGAKEILTLVMRKEKGAAKDAPVPAPVTLSLYLKAPAGLKKGQTPPPGSGKLYATVSNLDPLFELEPSAKDRLDKEVKDLRLVKLITSMERFTAKKLKFEGKPMGGSPLALENKDGKWTILPDKKEAASEKVQSMLDHLTGNRIKEFLEGKDYPAGDEGGVTLVLGDDKTEEKRKILFWKIDGKLYARDLQSKRKEAFLVDATLINDVPWDRKAFDKSSAPAPATAAAMPPAAAAMPVGAAAAAAAAARH